MAVSKHNHSERHWGTLPLPQAPPFAALANNPHDAFPGSVGGNVIHDMDTPVLGTDAANKDYVDGLSGARDLLTGDSSTFTAGIGNWIATGAPTTVTDDTGDPWPFAGQHDALIDPNGGGTFVGGYCPVPGTFKAGVRYAAFFVVKAPVNTDTIQLSFGQGGGGDVGQITVTAPADYQGFVVFWTPAADRATVVVSVLAVAGTAGFTMQLARCAVARDDVFQDTLLALARIPDDSGDTGGEALTIRRSRFGQANGMALRWPDLDSLDIKGRFGSAEVYFNDNTVGVMELSAGLGGGGGDLALQGLQLFVGPDVLDLWVGEKNASTLQLYPGSSDVELRDNPGVGKWKTTGVNGTFNLNDRPAAGPPGMDGADGEPGDPGAPGPAGAAGAAGATGPTGNTGATGGPGMDGEAGEDSYVPGPTGATGAAGAAGATGAAGAAGASGSPGVDGLDGEDGQPGATGPTGATGATGSAGAAGPQGGVGLTGDPGEDGVDSMIPGARGDQGVAGPTGPTGPQGIPGIGLDSDSDEHAVMLGYAERGASSTTPAAVGTAAVGTGTTDAHADHVHATGAGTPSTQAFSDAAAIGAGPAAAMTDHKHAMPDLGTGATNAAAGNDSRLSDSRAPTAHGASLHTDITRNVFLAAAGAKLDSATAANVGASPDLTGVVAYADAATQGAIWTFETPDDWTSGVITLQPVWSPGATDAVAHTVRWSIVAKAVAAGSTVTAAGTTVTFTGASSARTAGVVVYDTATSTTLTPAAAGDLFRFTLRRIGADAADTYVGVVNLLGVIVTYTANQ